MSLTRIDKDEWALQLAEHVAKRGTCPRRRVGCVLLNNRGHIIGTGYNGVASGLPHCEGEHLCPGAGLPTGTGLDKCEALHAEQNALLQCKSIYEIETAYITVSPCSTCAKLLLNTSCKRVVFRETYINTSAMDLWIGAGREWIHLPRQVTDAGTEHY